MPILPGLDGVQKMSKSLGNHIGVAEAPEEQFGRTMRIPDDALAEWYRLLAPGAPPPTGHPGQDKRRLASLIVDRFHGPGAGAAAEEHFNRTVRDQQVPGRHPGGGPARPAPCTCRRSWWTPWAWPRAARRAASSRAGASASTASQIAGSGLGSRRIWTARSCGPASAASPASRPGADGAVTGSGSGPARA